MTGKKILLIAVQLFICSILGAQSLSESLGGIKTNFLIFSDSIDLQVKDQIIIAKSDNYGYQSFHLEFITVEPVKVVFKKPKLNESIETTLLMVFFDSDGKELTSVSIPKALAKEWYSSSISRSPFYYSIDLIDVPNVLLDKTKMLSMVWLVSK
jgi:hypothetical protein